jgi:carotenoid cleavage dioxygenase-like enzyme
LLLSFFLSFFLSFVLSFFAPLSTTKLIPQTATDADEDDGYILSFLNNWTAEESDFVVFDAKDIAKGV